MPIKTSLEFKGSRQSVGGCSPPATVTFVLTAGSLPTNRDDARPTEKKVTLHGRDIAIRT